MTTAVADGRPPGPVLAVMNPVMRRLLRTGTGRLVRPFALLEFSGRRTGAHYRIPVGWHDLEGRPVVVTPAGWRANFTDGRPVVVHHRGASTSMIGTLERDPQTVTAAIQWIIDHGTPPAMVGLRMSSEHRLEVADVVAMDRALIRFEEAPAR